MKREFVGGMLDLLRRALLARAGEASLKIKLAVLALGMALLTAPFAAEAQPPRRLPRVGVIANSKGYEAFQGGLRELAFIDGQNVILEFRSTEAKDIRLADVAAELVRMKVDVIVAATTSAVLAVKEATATIPIVMLAADPVENGLVSNLARPGGNITGLSFNEQDTSAKRLELLREAVPSIRQVAVLITPANATTGRILTDTERAARAQRIQIHPVELRGPDDFEKAFAAMTARQADSLIVLPATLPFVHRTRIIALAIRNRLPAMFWRREFVDVGGLMSYGPEQGAMYRRAASYVSKILQGARPADLPVEPPSKFELIINVKTASAIGLTIPQSVLLLADEVIQ